MTVSILKGAEGNQAKELERLIRWLQKAKRPDIVHISNPMLLGVGKEIKQRLGVPVVCSLQDEDTWIDAMEPTYRDRTWFPSAHDAPGVDAFVAVSRYYGNLMLEKLRIDKDRLHIVHIGIDPARARPSELPEEAIISQVRSRYVGSMASIPQKVHFGSAP